MAGESEDIVIYDFKSQSVLQKIAAHKLRYLFYCIIFKISCFWSLIDHLYTLTNYGGKCIHILKNLKEKSPGTSNS